MNFSHDKNTISTKQLLFIKAWLKRGIQPIVSISILAYILSLADISHIWQIIKSSDIIYFLLGSTALFLSAVFEGAKFYLAFSTLQPRMCLKKTLFIQFISGFYATIIPAGMMSQELTRGVSYKKHGYSYTEVLGVFFALKGINLYWMSGLGLLGLICLGHNLQTKEVMVFACGFMLTTALVVLFGLNYRTFNFFENAFQNKIRIKTLNISDNFCYLCGFAKNLILNHRLLVWKILFANLVSIFFFILACVLLARAVGLDISFLNMTWTLGFSGLSQILPVGSQFMGAWHMTIWYVLGKLGYNADQVGSFLILVNSSILLNSLLGYPLTFLEKRDNFSLKQDAIVVQPES